MHVLRVFACAAASAAVLLATSAVIQAAEISYLTHWAPDTVAKLEAAAAAYSASHPGAKITVRAVPFGDLLTTLRSSGSGAHGVTIASIYDAWLPDLVKNQLVAPAPAAIAAETKANWPTSVVGAASVGGSLYGIPNEIDLYALNYNKKLFAEAGIAGAPKTWDEFLADAKKLTNKSKSQQGFGMINSWAAGVLHPFASLLVSDGGALVVNGKPTLDSKPSKETFELYETLIKSGYSDPAMATADANTTGPFLDNFVSGKTGMIIMANWWESALKAGMGDKFAEIATAPIPVGPSGDKPRSISYSWMTVVNAKASAEEQKEAWDFLDWLSGPHSGPKGASRWGTS
jgi:multiple sugar transport system substrate-binding protein